MRTLIVLALSAACVVFAADSGSLKTKVQPGRAGVFVDGKYVGPAANFGRARTYQVSAGEHEITLAEPRYEEVTKKVTIVAGKKTELSETLKALPLAKPPFGMIRTIHPDHMAAVFVNNRYMGHVDEFSNFAQGLKLNPGSYAVKIVPSGSGAPVEKTVTVEADKTSIVQ